MLLCRQDHYRTTISALECVGRIDSASDPFAFGNSKVLILCGIVLTA
jgi:hypothetical protein